MRCKYHNNREAGINGLCDKCEERLEDSRAARYEEQYEPVDEE